MPDSILAGWSPLRSDERAAQKLVGQPGERLWLELSGNPANQDISDIGEPRHRRIKCTQPPQPWSRWAKSRASVPGFAAASCFLKAPATTKLSYNGPTIGIWSTRPRNTPPTQHTEYSDTVLPYIGLVGMSNSGSSSLSNTWPTRDPSTTKGASGAGFAPTLLVDRNQAQQQAHEGG